MLTSLKCVVVVFASLIALATCLYTPSDDVIMLTADTFKTRVVDSNELWLVEFFAPWCGK